MILAADVGNSNIVLGIWDGREWTVLPRIDTHPVLNARDYSQRIQQLLDDENINQKTIDSVIISSVVPDVTPPLLKALADLFHQNPILLDAQTDTGMELQADHPERVGADLIADAVAAFDLVQDTCIVVDFGTATTVMAVEPPGALTGVAICGGLKSSVEALVGKAAQLPDIPLEIPGSPMGKNTIQAMQSGLVLGHLCMVEGLIDRMKKEIGAAKVVATGGLVSLFSNHTNYFDFTEPLLTLDGLRIIGERQGADGKGER